MTDCPGCGEPCDDELCEECSENDLTTRERHPPRPDDVGSGDGENHLCQRETVMSDDKCPWCGADSAEPHPIRQIWACGTWRYTQLGDKPEESKRSPQCRIRELEAELRDLEPLRKAAVAVGDAYNEVEQADNWDVPQAVELYEQQRGKLVDLCRELAEKGASDGA